MFKFWHDKGWRYVVVVKEKMIILYSLYMKLCGIDNPRIFGWLQKNSSKYTTADIQNEMLSVLSVM